MAREKDAELWEQLPEENAAQYEKFCAYLEMRYFPPDKPDGLPRLDRTVRRSLRGLAAAREYRRQTLEDLSARFSWVERAEAYDAEILRKVKAKSENDIIRMREKHAMAAGQMLNKATRRMLAIPEDEISASDLVRWVETGIKLERLSRGEPTETQQVTGTVTAQHTGRVDMSSLSAEELRAFIKMGGGDAGGDSTGP